jgi:hypothetical protein
MPNIEGYEIRHISGSQGHRGVSGPDYAAYSKEEAQKVINTNPHFAHATLRLIQDARYIQTPLGIWDNEQQIYLRLDPIKQKWVAFTPDAPAT